MAPQHHNQFLDGSVTAEVEGWIASSQWDDVTAEHATPPPLPTVLSEEPTDPYGEPAAKKAEPPPVPTSTQVMIEAMWPSEQSNAEPAEEVGINEAEIEQVKRVRLLKRTFVEKRIHFLDHPVFDETFAAYADRVRNLPGPYRLEPPKEWLRRRQQWGLYHDELVAIYGEAIQESWIPDVRVDTVAKDVGMGVFAVMPFSQGDFLGEYTGIVRPCRPSLPPLGNPYHFHYSPLARGVDQPYAVIDGEHFGNHTRFFNHADVPNVEVVHVYMPKHPDDEPTWHVIFIAARDIHPGEQLLIRYKPGHVWRTKRRYL